jgi:cell division protein FtsQ
MPVRARFSRSIARVETVPLPWRGTLPQLRPRAWLARIAPSRRSTAIGLGILVLTGGAYLLARETSIFAIDRIEVQGGSPQVAAQIRRALGSFTGTPLVGLDGSAVLRKVDALPTVVSASYDRDFPHTLRIAVVPERPAAVLRRGPESWLVSTRGRVVEGLPAHADVKLPRIWVSTTTQVHTGTELASANAAGAARAVGRAGAFADRVATALYTEGTLVFRLRSGFELVLGDAADIGLKVAVAERVLTMLPPGSTYLDVSTPGRPVSGTGSPLVFGTTKLK